jgi:hypothetical protein
VRGPGLGRLAANTNEAFDTVRARQLPPKTIIVVIATNVIVLVIVDMAVVGD